MKLSFYAGITVDCHFFRSAVIRLKDVATHTDWLQLSIGHPFLDNTPLFGREIVVPPLGGLGVGMADQFGGRQHWYPTIY